MALPPVAVIGAGVAGLACAASLHAAGRSVVVFDKGRGLGGRLATRRQDGVQWDHGAQYLTAGTEEFARILDGLPVWQASGEGNWRVGAPSQNALVKPWAEHIDIRLSTRVTSIARHDGGWVLACEDGSVSKRFPVLAVTAPAPQTAALLPAGFSFPGLAAVTMSPCWTLMVATRRPLDVPPYLTQPHQEVAWMAADHTKPGRRQELGQYVLQASGDWSRCHLELAPDAAAEQLLGFFATVVKQPMELVTAQAHRWRYALTERPLGQPCVYEPESGLGLAGDWCLGHKAEHAYLSGRALADAIKEERRVAMAG